MSHATHVPMKAEIGGEWPQERKLQATRGRDTGTGREEEHNHCSYLNFVLKSL